MFTLETHFKEIQKSKRFIIMRLLFKNLLIEKSYSSTAACAAANFEANILIFNDLRLDWSTFELQFSCILHVLHVDVS